MSFKVGDRVKVYFCSPSQAFPHEIVGTIRYIFCPEEQYPPNFEDSVGNIFQVQPDNEKDYLPSYIHEKQCRKLVKKKKEVKINDPKNSLECMQLIRKFNEQYRKYERTALDYQNELKNGVPKKRRKK